MRKRKSLSLLAALMTVPLILTACGGSDSGGKGSGTADTSKVFRFAAENAVNTLDPQLVSSTYAGIWYGPAYENLVRQNLDGTFTPSLATSWKLAADYLSITFTLREGVTFHDGSAFDAAAVKAVLERGKTVKGSNATAALANIKSVDAVDAKTVRLNFANPASEKGTLAVLADRGTEMISPMALTRNDLATAPDGTGAYQIVSYAPGNKAVYKRFSGWWGGTPKLAGIEITTVSDRNAAYNGLQSGQFDMVPLPPDQLDAAKGNSSVTVYEFASPQVDTVLLNIDGKFADLRVRQALSYATDRKAFATATGPQASATYQFATPGTDEYDEGIKGTYDVAKAKQLLGAAGFASGFSFRLNYSARPAQQIQAEALQAMWKKAGIDVTLEATEGATTIQKCVTEKACDALLGPLNRNLDFLTGYASYGTTPRYLSKGFIPEVVTAVQEANKATEKDARAKASKHLNNVVAEQLPELPLTTQRYTYATTTKVIDGFDFSVNQYPFYQTVSIAT